MNGRARRLRQSTRRARALCCLAVSLLSAAPGRAQQGTIEGRITDMETGAPLVSASVEALGQRGPVATDASGDFRLSVPAGAHSLLVTLIGYETARTDGVTVEAGETASVAIRLRSRALLLNQLVVTVSRREEKELDAPASVSTLTNQQISRIIARTPADHVKTLPGVDLASTGLTQSYAVVRGFNNVASGRLLSIVDNRYARIPALRINAINMIPITFDGRWRFSDGFDMSSGVFRGRVDGYEVVDITAGYQLPFQPNTRLELTVYNALDNRHREFVGAPELGRLALGRVRYDF